jgi:hypothetical protein
MRSKNLRYLFASLLGVLMLLNGCRSGRVVTEPEKPAAEDSNLRLISMLEQRTHRFSTMKIRRADVDLSLNGVQETIRGNIAIYRDSLIVISVIPALGYEFLRIMCTSDSVIIINRPEKSYFASSFEYYKKKYGIPIDFADLQALIANEVFYYKDDYGDRIYERQLRTRDDNNLFIVDAFRDGKRITNQGIEIDQEGRRLENIFIVDYDTKMRLNLDYQEFTGDGDLLFPKRLKIDLIESNNTIKMEITYGQIVFNDSLNVEFSVPEHYTRGDL